MKKERKLMHVTVWGLIAAIAISTLTACTSSSSPDQTQQMTAVPTTTTAPETTETTVAETEPAFVYADVNYNDEKFSILNTAERYNMIYTLMPEEITGEALNDERYKINAEVQNRYNVKIIETQIAYADKLAYAKQELMANDSTHDVMYFSSTHHSSMMRDGFLLNLLDIDTLQLDQYWWDQNLKKDATLKDNYLYYAASDYHLQGFDATTCIYFNKPMLEQLGLQSPYDFVRDSTWTFDKLYEYCAQGANLNGDTSYAYQEDGSTIYGFTCNGNVMPAFIVGNGARYIEKGENGAPYVAFDEEHFISVCQKIGLLTSAEGTFLNGSSNALYLSLFMNGRSLFMGGEIKSAANEMRDVGHEFGILPFPKYNEQQENYYANMYYATELMSIPVTCKDVDRAAIIMDTLSYESTERVLPIYYERVCYKGLRDQDSIDMLEIIREGRYLNWPLLFSWLTSTEPTVHKMLINGDGNVASLVASTAKVVQQLIDKTMASLE